MANCDMIIYHKTTRLLKRICSCFKRYGYFNELPYSN